MKREFLRGLGIDEEHIQKILDEHHDGVREYKDSANKVTDLEAQLQTANDELSKRDTQIEDLKASTTDNTDLQKQLDEFKTTNANYEEELKRTKLNNAIKLAVAKDANDPNDVLTLLDKEGLELDGDTVKGLDDKLTALRESKAYLFEQPKGKTGRTPGEGTTPNTVTKDEFDKMKYEEKVDLYNTNKPLYDEFTK